MRIVWVLSTKAIRFESGGASPMLESYPVLNDLATVAYWYQTEPHASFPELPGIEYLEVV